MIRKKLDENVYFSFVFLNVCSQVCWKQACILCREAPLSHGGKIGTYNFLKDIQNTAFTMISSNWF